MQFLPIGGVKLRRGNENSTSEKIFYLLLNTFDKDIFILSDIENDVRSQSSF